MKNKIIIAVAGLLLLGAGMWYASTSDRTVSDVSAETEIVAVINGEEISRDDFDKLQAQIASQFGVDVTQFDEQTKELFLEQAIDELISQTLLRQVVSRSDIKVAADDIDLQLDAIRSQFENDALFEEALFAEGLTKEELRLRVGLGLSTQVYLEQELAISSVVATESEITAVYEQTSSSGEGVPPLEDVYGEVEKFVIQQKKQEMIANLVEELRLRADIQILI